MGSHVAAGMEREEKAAEVRLKMSDLLEIASYQAMHRANSRSTSYLKIADLQAHNASHRDAL